MKKCMYCKAEISDDCVVDFCEVCGKRTWGDKMFNAIIENMENARDNGDLCHANNTCDLFPESNDKKFTW